MSCNNEHYYRVHTFMNDEELTEVWDIIEKAMNRHGYDVSNAELSMKLYDDELEENLEYDMEQYLSSLSEGKDQSQPVEKVSQVHRRRDLDLL